tara:strand:- start:66 stop:623 length:558 start_codon:yes stop_codon:yes gene_type:complete
LAKKRLILRKETAALFILFIMVFSVFAIWKTSQENKEEHNGFDFTLTQNGWTTIINKQQFLFNYLPKDLEDLNSTPILITTPKVYVTYNPENKGLDKSYTLEYLRSLFYQNNIRPVLSCTQEKDCPEQLPIIDCDNAEADVVLIQSGDESKIFKQGKCFIIQSEDNSDLTVLRERFVYSFLKVMD